MIGVTKRDTRSLDYSLYSHQAAVRGIQQALSSRVPELRRVRMYISWYSARTREERENGCPIPYTRTLNP